MSAVPDRDHPIIDAPWSHQLTELRYVVAGGERSEDHIDLMSERVGRSRTLRFFSPADLTLAGRPTSFGLCVLDIRGRGLETLRVQVDNFEERAGLRFLAREVVEVEDDAV